MQINRLFEIVYLLLEKRTITAKELANRFEVSTRTIYRDIDILSAANIPIYCNKGKGGGISLLEDFVLDKSLLSEVEQNEILSSLQGLEKLNILTKKDTLEKMSRIFCKNAIQWLDIDFSSWSEYPEKEDRFELLKKAILNQQKIEFIYYNSLGEELKRKVEPLQIKFKDKSWYLLGFCELKQDIRIFKIQRMEQITIIKENFERKELPKEENKNVTIEMIDLELEISKKMAYRVYDEFKKEEITKKEDGNFLIQVSYPKTDWVYGYILSFGEYLKVITPKEVKQHIRSQAEKIIKNNS